MLKLKNTLTKNLEEFESITSGEVKIYHCGPTVYWTQHIGNLRAMLMGDLVRRTLMYLGYEVQYVRNYTDVGHLTDDGDEGEDKMAKGAKREGTDPMQIAEKYIAQFDQDTNLLNILPATVGPRATENIENMINMVAILVEKDFGYVTPEAVYFDTSKAKDYTRLSGQKLEFNRTDMGHGEVSVDETSKRNPSDFALWFFKTGRHANAIQTWESPFESPEVENGEGFPGWHIECSAMAKAELGSTIDIHIGGIEHIPVHHTNEIAQSESANGEPFAHYWLHNEHLNIDGEKISKSLGNGYVLQDILDKGFAAEDLRYMFLQAHYRSPQNFTWESLTAARTARLKLKEKVSELFAAQDIGEEVLMAAPDAELHQQFVEAIEEDVNIPKALAILWEATKADLNPEVKLATILDFDKVLGLNLEVVDNPHREQDYLSEEVSQLLDLRSKARTEKNWVESDRIRDVLLVNHQLEVKDTDDGQKVTKTIKP